jgi:hypothetical protein
MRKIALLLILAITLSIGSIAMGSGHPAYATPPDPCIFGY